jgi:dihydrofolate reductase
MTGQVSIALVAAVADNGVIGSAGAMPWRLATDMKRFRSLTMGKPVIMGRKTFASIGKALAGRTNIVVTRQRDVAPEDAIVAPGLAEALEMGRAAARESGADEVMVIGGGEIYALAMAEADRLYITHVHARPAGDTRFPAIDPAVWRAVSREEVPEGGKDSAATTFVTYERRSPAVPG